MRYLFVGKSGAVLLGYPDTTQDADLFVEKSAENGRRCAAGVRDLSFDLSDETEAELQRGKHFVQLKNGPFDTEGFPVCHPDDIIKSKEAARRAKDLESLPRLRAFRDYWMARR